MSERTTRGRIRTTELLLAALFGVIATLAVFAGFGVGGQVEHVPIILRQMDAAYLARDYFVNAVSGSIARDGYARLIAALCATPNDLPGVMASLALASNVAMALCTCIMGWQLYGKRPGAGAASAALAMSVTTFELGWRDTIFLSYLMPAQLALPMSMGAMILALRGRPVLAVLLSALASLGHPLIGLETGGLVLFAWLVATVSAERGFPWQSSKRLLGASVILAAFAVVLWLPQHQQQSIPGDLFVQIVAHVRNPHHHLPSTFAFQDWARGVAFVTACVLLVRPVWLAWSPQIRRFLGALALAIGALCIGGWLWVEVWPTRLWTTAQVYRLLFLVRWVGLVIVGGTLALPGASTSRRITAWACALNPFSLLAASLVPDLIHPSGHTRRGSLALVLVLCWSLCMLLWIWLGLPVLGIVVGAVAIATLTISLGPARWRMMRWVLPICVGALLWRFMTSRVPDTRGPAASDGGISAALVASELGTSGTDIALFARRSTSPDAVFLTPPMWGQFRLLAHRAIVIDYKAFIYTDAGMSGWYARLNTVYGKTSARGYAAARAYDAQYRTITDQRMIGIGAQYGADYAVLYAETESALPTMYANDRYLVVDLR